MCHPRHSTLTSINEIDCIIIHHIIRIHTVCHISYSTVPILQPRRNHYVGLDTYPRQYQAYILPMQIY